MVCPLQNFVQTLKHKIIIYVWQIPSCICSHYGFAFADNKTMTTLVTLLWIFHIVNDIDCNIIGVRLQSGAQQYMNTVQ